MPKLPSTEIVPQQHARLARHLFTLLRAVRRARAVVAAYDDRTGLADLPDTIEALREALAALDA